MIRSPATLARSWDAPTDHYYPMLRIQRRTDAARLGLGTVFFDLQSKELAFVLDARNRFSTKTTQAIDDLQQTLSGHDLIAAIVVEMLRTERLLSARAKESN